jgi:hypothetical protein
MNSAFNIPAGWKIERSGQSVGVIEVTAPDGTRWCVVAPTDEDDRERKIGAFFHELCAAMLTPPVDAVPGEPVAPIGWRYRDFASPHWIVSWGPDEPYISWASYLIEPIFAAPVASRAGMEPVKWPTMPPSKGQAPVLFEDGYAEGWAKCLSMCKAAIAPSAPAEAKDAVRAEPVADDLRKLKFVYRVLGNYAHAPVPDRADAYVMVRELIDSTWNRGRAIEAPTFQQGYDEAISACAALGWKTPAVSEDTKRLDWLEEHGEVTLPEAVRFETTDGMRIYSAMPGSGELRDAIDAAMRAAAEGGQA